MASEGSIVEYASSRGYHPETMNNQQQIYRNPIGNILAVEANGKWILTTLGLTLLAEGENIPQLIEYLGK